MQPRIEILKPKKLIGCAQRMSVLNNKTGQLWRQFAPRIKEIDHRASNDRISLQVYEPSYHQSFSPRKEFIKWAAVEILQVETIPAGMSLFDLQGGLYAVFDYKGLSTDTRVFQYIYGEWLPQSPYLLDDRPHFEVLGAKYKNNDPNSEEEIWIPIKDH